MADNESNYLEKSIKQYENDDSIENIVIVTHTIPLINYCDKGSEDTEYNSKFENILKFKKISHWIFGHTHSHYETKINNITFICNPRGRPEEVNRISYNLKTSKL